MMRTYQETSHIVISFPASPHPFPCSGSISNQDQVGRSYAPKGQTPVVRRTAKKLSTSMISAVNNRGQMRFMCFKGALNAGLFIVFLSRLIKGASSKIFLIVDNLRVHNAVKVS